MGMIQGIASKLSLDKFSYQASVTERLIYLGCHSLEQRRNYSRLCLFYKIIYGLVEIDLPPYVEHPSMISLTIHTNLFMVLSTDHPNKI